MLKLVLLGDYFSPIKGPLPRNVTIENWQNAAMCMAQQTDRINNCEQMLLKRKEILTSLTEVPSHQEGKNTFTHFWSLQKTKTQSNESQKERNVHFSSGASKRRIDKELEKNTHSHFAIYCWSARENHEGLFGQPSTTETGKNKSKFYVGPTWAELLILSSAHLHQDWINLQLNSLFVIPGDGIGKGFFPVLIPIGICGNVLSFLVSFDQFLMFW